MPDAASPKSGRGWFASRFGPRFQRAKNSTASTFASMSPNRQAPADHDRASMTASTSTSVSTAVDNKRNSQHWNESKKAWEDAPTDLVDLRGRIDSGDVDALALAIFHALPVLGDPEMGSAAWLGDDLEERAALLQHFCLLFNWHEVSILDALRGVCFRIRLLGETQQIGRVLTAVSHHWLSQNPRNGYQTEAVVNRVVYSLVLLNTDLHSPRESGRSKLTEQQYVDNVLNALAEDVVKLRFASSGPTNVPAARSLVKDPGPFGKPQWTGLISRELRTFYRSIASRALPMPETAPISSIASKQRLSNIMARCNTVSSRVSLRKNSSSRSLTANSWNPMDQTTTRDSSLSRGSFPTEDDFGEDEGIDKLRLKGPPWAKEGPLDFQVYASTKKMHRTKNRPEAAGWADAFALVDRGQLRLYRITSTATRTRSSDGSVEPLGEGDWLRSARLLKTYGLIHALAQATASDSRWFLTLSNGRIIQFRCGSHITARDYVYTCNYWAARLSKPPISEMVASTEYGWGRPVDIWNSTPDGEKLSAWASSDDSITIRGERITVHPWVHQPDTGLHSGLTTEDQLAQLEQYVASVDIAMAEHSAHMAKLLRIFQPNLPITERVMANWEARSQWLLKQSVLYSSYCSTLRQVLAEEKQPEVDPAQPATPLFAPPAIPDEAPNTPDSSIARMVAPLDAINLTDGVHPLPFPVAADLPPRESTGEQEAQPPQHHFPFPF